MLLPLVETGMLPFLHDAAHGVNGTVAEVGPQHLPHQLETESRNECAPSQSFLNIDFKKRWVCSDLPASLTELLHIHCTTKGDDEDGEGVWR